MSNKPNFKPGGVHGFPPGNNHPPIRPVQLDLNTCASFHCGACHNNALTPAFLLFEVPAIIANTPNGQPALVKTEAWMCVNCGAVWRIDQLRKLTPREREIARAEREMQEEIRAAHVEGLEEETAFNKESSNELD